LSGAWKRTVLLAVALACVSAAAHAGGPKVTVDLSQAVNVVTNTSLAMPVAPTDGDALKPEAAPYVRLSGATMMRFPGGHGIADLYHWSANSLTKWNGAGAPWVSGDNNIGNLAKSLDRLGTALIVVNYGSSPDGKKGGDPGEAAAWVAYMNGDPSDARPVPKDKDGDDWKTVGYWATLRGEQLLASDDGLNFLRIGHPKPFAVSEWQIGDQVYNNGFYGMDHTGNPDLHGPAPAKEKDFGRLEKNANLSPSFYGERVTEYAAAMKAVDPTIHIGASLVAPEGHSSDDDYSKKMWMVDWDQKVLRAGCKAIDFETVEMQPGDLRPPDWTTLNEAGLLSGTRTRIGELLSKLIEIDKSSCPSGRVPRIGFSAASLPGWAHLDHAAFPALWVADTYAVLVETGAESVAWSEMHSANMLSPDGKKLGPAFMGMAMLHVAAHNLGDVLVKSSSSSSTLAVHAVKRRDGNLGLMLINENPDADVTVSVQITGGNVAAKGKRVDWGQQQQKAGTQFAQSPLEGLGSTFTVTVPAYTVTDILVPLAN
jgi:alpha-L-arabinofuranosidase